MRNTLYIIIALIATLLFPSCEKEVKLDLGPPTPKLVVEGSIESNGYPFVQLTKSVGFFGRVDVQTLLNSFVHDAKVTVSDGSRTVQLKEYTLSIDSFNISAYTIDTSDASSLGFRGEVGRSYDLKVEVDGKTYTSTTTIQPLSSIDSIYSIPPKEGIPDDEPDAMSIYVRYTDPPAIGNRVRNFVSINGSLYQPPFFSVYDDNIINGGTIDFEISPGVDKQDTGRAVYFTKGDTVDLKWCSIDNATYNFFNTLEFGISSTGNPFAAPVQVLSNISNGALGVWAGYGVRYYRIIIPK